MKRPLLPLLLTVFTFTSCETTHRAAVSTFRVVDAPAAYVRRKLAVDEEPPRTTTTQTNVYSDSTAYPPTQPYPPQQPPPPVQTPNRIVTEERNRKPEPEA